MRNGGHWSDPHGTFEHHQAYDFAREAAPARDCAADLNVAQYHQEVSERGNERATVRYAGAVEQA